MAKGYRTWCPYKEGYKYLFDDRPATPKRVKRAEYDPSTGVLKVLYNFHPEKYADPDKSRLHQMQRLRSLLHCRKMIYIVESKRTIKGDNFTLCQLYTILKNPPTDELMIRLEEIFKDCIEGDYEKIMRGRMYENARRYFREKKEKALSEAF